METHSPRNSGEVDPREGIPWEALTELARHWAGAGSLFDWVTPPEWEITREWKTEASRARAALALLLHLNELFFNSLPHYFGAWMDLLEQEVQRLTSTSDFPTPHTDWVATASEFGRYPALSYVERHPSLSFDNSSTRILKAMCTLALRSEAEVKRVLGRTALSDRSTQVLSSALELPQVIGAAELSDEPEFDAVACRALGGAWLTVARAWGLLNTLWQGSLHEQLIALAPILPQTTSQLFELGVLATAANNLRRALPLFWRSRTPLAAADPGLPCLVAAMEDLTVEFFYQTVPAVHRPAKGPYRVLGQTLGAGMLRPDIWIVIDAAATSVEILVECKFSRDTSYVATGISETMAYSLEYPCPSESDRVQYVACPSGLVAGPASWQGTFALGTPDDLGTLVRAAVQGRVGHLLGSWAQ